mgnify:CR=1 FL=1
MSAIDRALAEYVSVMGAPLPELVFPATITGIAKPQYTEAGRWPGASVGLAVPQPDGSDPAGYMDCASADTPDARGFYLDSFLPRTVFPVRYRWRAEFYAASSEGCGWRQLADGTFLPWRQCWFAVNTAHHTQDGQLDYPFIRAGTLVIMQFSDLTAITGTTGGPRYGFSFNHMADPIGEVVACSEQVSTIIGCCDYYDAGSTMYACLTEDECLLRQSGYWRSPAELGGECVEGGNCQ